MQELDLPVEVVETIIRLPGASKSLVWNDPVGVHKLNAMTPVPETSQ